MIVQLMMFPFWILIYNIIGMLPVLTSVPSGFNALLDIIGYGCAFIGTDFFLALIGNFVFWLTTQLAWAVIEWVYRKFPGIY